MTPVDAAAEVIRKTLVSWAQSADAEPALWLSAGVDSSSVLMALLEADKKPACYSWMVDGVLSTDASVARATCEALGVKHQMVMIPRDEDLLAREIAALIKQFGLTKKTEVECSIPRLFAARVTKEREVWTGDMADAYFGLSRRGSISGQRGLNEMNEYREWYLNRQNPASVSTLRGILNALGKTLMTPWVDQEILKAIRPLSWAESNKPRQKEPARRAFPELDQLRVENHMSFQLGDSRISETLMKLMEGKHNHRNRKNAAALYRDLAAA